MNPQPPQRRRADAGWGSRPLLVPVVLAVLTVTACAAPAGTSVAGAANPAGADLLLPVTAPVTLTLGQTAGSPPPTTEFITAPAPDPVVGTPDLWSWMTGDRQIRPDVQWYADEFGLPADEAFRQLTAGQAAERLFDTDPTVDYTVIEHDPFQFVVGSTQDRVTVPASIGGCPVVLERPAVPPQKVRQLFAFVSTALQGQPFAGSLDLRAGTVTVTISHDAAAAAIAGIAGQVAESAPARLVVQRHPQPVAGSPPADDVDLIVTPDRILLEGVDLGRPGPDGPVLEMGGGSWTDGGALRDANPGLGHCVGSGDLFHAYSIRTQGSITGGG